jgi:hypothetical protein
MVGSPKTPVRGFRIRTEAPAIGVPVLESTTVPEILNILLSLLSPPPSAWTFALTAVDNFANAAVTVGRAYAIVNMQHATAILHFPRLLVPFNMTDTG